MNVEHDTAVIAYLWLVLAVVATVGVVSYLW